MSTLIIAPHPDDEVLGCGGTIAKLISQGEQVTVAVLTAGVPGLITPELLRTVRQEFAAAMAVLGVHKTVLLDFSAGHLAHMPGHPLADAIRDLLHADNVTTLFVPHERDLHTDHAAACRAALVAARPLAGCSVRRILAYETLSETEWGSPLGSSGFEPTVFEDISPTMSLKLQAMQCYQSQVKAFPHPRSLQAIQALAQVRGSHVTRDACEAFVLLREIR